MRTKLRPTVHGRYAAVARELLALAMTDGNATGAAQAFDALRLVVSRARCTASGYLSALPEVKP